MNSELIDELLCPQCLRYFSKFPWLDKKTNVQASKGYRKGHMRRCQLPPYQDLVAEEGDRRVFCVGPKSSKKERHYAYRVDLTVVDSDEISGMGGWSPSKNREDEETFHPHAFVPVVAGSTAGILVVRKRLCATSEWEQKDAGKPLRRRPPRRRWCVDRIWIHKPYRRDGVAKLTVVAAARHFGIEPCEMGWLVPWTPAGKALARALSPRCVHVTM